MLFKMNLLKFLLLAVLFLTLFTESKSIKSRRRMLTPEQRAESRERIKARRKERELKEEAQRKLDQANAEETNKDNTIEPKLAEQNGALEDPKVTKTDSSRKITSANKGKTDKEGKTVEQKKKETFLEKAKRKTSDSVKWVKNNKGTVAAGITLAGLGTAATVYGVDYYKNDDKANSMINLHRGKVGDGIKNIKNKTKDLYNHAQNKLSKKNKAEKIVDDNIDNNNTFLLDNTVDEHIEDPLKNIFGSKGNIDSLNDLNNDNNKQKIYLEQLAYNKNEFEKL